jgi:transcriptional regulator with XRE-family HTH domain
MLRTVGTSLRRIDGATRRTRRSLAALGTDIRHARVAAGLSQTRVGAAAGMSHSQVSRIESGRYESVRVIDLAHVASIVGLDVALRTYPGPDPLRDVAHIRLLERLRSEVAPTLEWQVEVPIGPPRDQRAWDAVIAGAGPLIAVEAETRIVDLQLIERRIGLKRRDSGIGRVVLLLSNSRWNRQAIELGCGLLQASFPVSGADALTSLLAGRDPGGSAVILL